MRRPWDFLDEYRNDPGKPVTLTNRWPSIQEMFDITVDRFGNRTAFTSFDPSHITMTYRKAQDHIRRIAAYLGERKIGVGTNVAVTGKNSPEWALAYLSILYAGATVVPLDYQLHTPDVQGLLHAADVSFVFVDEEKYDDLRAAGFSVISLSPERGSYILELDAAEPAHRAESQAADRAAILFTSGTTGSAKGVVLSHENIVSDCYLAQANLNISENDVFYALLPIHHSYTMLAVFIEAISVGAEIVFAKRMAVKQILQDLKRGSVTMLLGIPLLFNKLLKGILNGIRERGPLVYGVIRTLMFVSGLVKKMLRRNPGKKIFHSVLEKASLESIRICICGGGPLPSATFRRFNQLGIDFVQGYGLTETSPILTLNPVDAYKEESVGKVLPETEMKIIDPDTKGIGEIVVRGPMLMEGYYNDPEATAEMMTGDGFLRTGDVGYLDRENYLYLTGRKKNLIVTAGGKNVYPEEIEDRFQLYDEIDQILVKGYVRDARTHEEEIEALIYPDFEFLKSANGGSLPVRQEIEERIFQIVDVVNKEMLRYQRIKRTTVLDEPMEMTTTKKIKRHKVAGPSEG